MLFLDKDFYFFVLFSLARSVSKEERRKDFIRWSNWKRSNLSIFVYGFETSNGNFDFTCLSNFFL